MIEHTQANGKHFLRQKTLPKATRGYERAVAAFASEAHVNNTKSTLKHNTPVRTERNCMSVPVDMGEIIRRLAEIQWAQAVLEVL